MSEEITEQQSDSQSSPSEGQEYSVFAQMLAEYLGSLFLVMAAISPIILFHHSFKTDIGLAVLADALAVGFVLFALIEMFEPVSGAHFNPAVSLAMALSGQLRWRLGVGYVLVQVVGGLTGTLCSHLMFFHENPTLFEISNVARSGGNYVSELLCTFVLVLAILLLVAHQSSRISLVVGLLVGGQLIATSSTMFANPQVTLARMFTYAVAGVHPIDGLVFILMEILAAMFAVTVFAVMRRK